MAKQVNKTLSIKMSGKSYREKAYILKDIILILGEYGQLNQTALVSFCGLNLKKHRHFLNDLKYHGMIAKFEEMVGKRAVTNYKVTQKGLEFCKTILEPYEELFPRKTKSAQVEQDPPNPSLL